MEIAERTFSQIDSWSKYLGTYRCVPWDRYSTAECVLEMLVWGEGQMQVVHAYLSTRGCRSLLTTESQAYNVKSFRRRQRIVHLQTPPLPPRSLQALHCFRDRFLPFFAVFLHLLTAVTL